MKRRTARKSYPGLWWLCGMLILVVVSAVLAGCTLYSSDHCWVPEDQYLDARTLYIQTGSLEIVKRRMEEMQWRICRRNEVVYRLQREFEVLPEELPAG